MAPASLALDISPVVIQVPDFGDRFWVYQVVDLRTDSVVQLGKMYGTTPGFYLLVGPDWKGEVPKGITKVFRSSTNTGFVAPRVFQDDTPEDKRAIQAVLPAGHDVSARRIRRHHEDARTGARCRKLPPPPRPARRRRNGCSRRSSSTSFPPFSPTRRRCRARRRATRRCSPCSTRARTIPR